MRERERVMEWEAIEGDTCLHFKSSARQIILIEICVVIYSRCLQCLNDHP